MYFLSKGILGAAIITLVSSVTHPNTTTQNNSPGLSIITALIQQLISPKPGDGISIKTRAKPYSTREGTIEWAIQNKVTQLKKYLQDDDDMLEEKEEETIIIEFLPKHNNAGKEKHSEPPKNDSSDQALKNENGNKLRSRATNSTGDETTHVPPEKEKYLKVRERIRTQLVKEEVSGEAADYILKKVDYLIERLIKSECTLKSSDKNKPRSQDERVNFSVKWTKRWKDIKKRYFDVIKDLNSTNIDKDSKLSKAMEEYGKFFSSIIEDVNLMSNVYSLQCKLIKKKSNANGRKVNDITELCKRFKICSSELIAFLNYFYFSLNDAVIDALKNYAAMYSVDVAADENESDNDVTKTIKKFVEKTKKTIRKTFETELDKFTLDKNKDSAANMDLIKSFVNNTLMSLESIMKKNIGRTLDRYGDVQEDIYLNLKAEIDEYNRVSQKKICKSFQTCNGNGRRSFGYNSMVEGSDVYVNVRVGVNDDKSILLSNGRRRFVNENRYQATVRSRFIPYKSLSHKSRKNKHKRNGRKRRMNVEVENKLKRNGRKINMNVEVEDNSTVPSKFNSLKTTTVQLGQNSTIPTFQIKLNNYKSILNLKSLRRKISNRRSNDLNKINQEIIDKSKENKNKQKQQHENNNIANDTNLATDDTLTSKFAFKARISIDKDNALVDMLKNHIMKN